MKTLYPVPVLAEPPLGERLNDRDDSDGEAQEGTSLDTPGTAEAVAGTFAAG